MSARIDTAEVQALREALERVRVAIGMPPGIAQSPGDIASETEKRMAPSLVCPVCHQGDEAWLRCNYPGCCDGRGLIPAKNGG